MQEKNSFYQERAERFQTLAMQLHRRYNRLSMVRLGVFLAGAVIAVYLFGWHWWAGGVFTFLFLIAFARLVSWHQKLEKKAAFNEQLAKIQGQECQALANDLSAFPHGESFMDAQHPYSSDLDIFGQHSIFAACCRTTTSLGMARLAAWLQQPAATPVIAGRQAAIKELGPMYDWRHQLRAIGMELHDNPFQLAALSRWILTPPFVTGNTRMWVARHFAPVIAIAGIVLWACCLSWQVSIWFFLPSALVLAFSVKKVNEIHDQTGKAVEILEHYGSILAHIEQQSFTSEKLKNLHGAFKDELTQASNEVKWLAYFISQLNVRYNVFAILLNITMCWDLQWVDRLERWKILNRERMPRWFDALAEIEALASLANLHFNNPEWSFPIFVDDTALDGMEIGHPLIATNKRVGNDFSMLTKGHIKLITGSNMGGKSTFLRTVGVNIVLAQTGAPVCAKHLQLPALQVFSSMRTQDALQENASSFYAELKRLQQIISAVEAGQQDGFRPFFLLDEILKGTNSVDRHTGAKALIHQLISDGGAGLIATHDLELGALETAANGSIENLCLEVEIRDGALYFDYKLRKGISQSFNATILMQQMGIKV